MENKPKIRIYVACLASYNSGILHGAWINAAQEAWAIFDETRAMLARSPQPDAKEWAIHDYEGFEDMKISEYAGFESVAEMAAFIAEHGRLGAELIGYYGNVEDARSAMENNYAGEYQSLADFAQELTEQSVAIPESVLRYVDYERMARDLEINDVTVFETSFEQVHVFWN